MPREQARSVIGFADVPGAATGEDQRSLLRSAHEEGDAEKMMRITKVKNRLDPQYDERESAGYRDLCINVEVGWTFRNAVLTFVPVRDWEELQCLRHICEIQICLKGMQTLEVEHSEYVEMRNVANL